MEILKNYISFEETIKGSRFLSELFPCTSQSSAREMIKSQKEKYSDSTHVVHAFIIGSSGEIMGMSDDGEPSGTAGRPALDVLKGRGCTNILLTITRWFGGTLLGTGGLVKAYSGGAKNVIASADSQNLFEELVEKTSFSFECDYSLYKTVKKIMNEFHVSSLQEDFSSSVKINGEIHSSEKTLFKTKLLDASNGKITLL